MLHIPILRSKRLTVQLRELTIGESIALASMPPGQFEAECTAFLRRAIDTVKGIQDPAAWTVQERMLAVCHYLAATLPDGPDFSLGNGKYSDYLDGANDQGEPGPVAGGDVGGDVWSVRHLTGGMAESIERIEGEIAGVSGRLHWLVGCMAAQMVRSSEDASDPEEEGAFDEFLCARMQTFFAYPETEFELMLAIFTEARDKLSHLFRVEIADTGLVATAKGGEASDLPPARFPVSSCLSKLATQLARKPV